MGLCFVALVERLWSSAAQATPFAVTVCGPVPLRARVLPNALPGPNVVGAVREGFLEASSVCLLVVAVEALEHNLNSTATESTDLYKMPFEILQHRRALMIISIFFLLKMSSQIAASL